MFYIPLESQLKQKLRDPFIEESQRKLIVHCCYHKVGTAWFIRVLRSISRYYGLNFQCSAQSQLKRDTDVFMEYMSQIDEKKLPERVGSHLIRDPRDIVISGYFYHLWTKEEWAHIPRQSLENLTYQEYLNSLTKEEGLLAEMEGTSGEIIQKMSAWNYNNPHFIEVRYEDLIANEKQVFAKIFAHYQFNQRAIYRCLEIAEKFSFQNRTKRKKGTVKKNSHLRSGKAKQWEKIFTQKHKTRFKELFGDVLIQLGYETSYDW